MKKLTFIVVAVVFAATTAFIALPKNKSSKNKWIKLFDGKTLEGWHSYGKAEPGKAWKVEDDCIHLDAASKKSYQTDGGGDLVTNEEFENYDLKLEWKISKNGNSGIIFNVHEEVPMYDESWRTGMEMQILDNDGHADGKIHKHRAGDLYDLIACSKETVKPVGEWNEAEIICNKGNLELKLNGTTVVKTTLWNDAWKQLIAGSKFKKMPNFGTFTKGRIALQDHGNDVWFRNIMIKKL
ncbi:MAG: DUF1080 domain-containing protein [Bacteroidetes bacterium]|nr:DUF1080 domain-containing protein [Bacteroidota bacterium]MBS1648383.1 DUF1080 domain-containing protein [Bacteroidota bacterium]